ncbi:hypothetical protein Hanom_Chr03g00276751 [Helianthus anomalus]
MSSNSCKFFFFERQIWITDGPLEYHRTTNRTTRSYPSPLYTNSGGNPINLRKPPLWESNP